MADDTLVEAALAATSSNRSLPQLLVAAILEMDISELQDLLPPPLPPLASPPSRGSTLSVVEVSVEGGDGDGGGSGGGSGGGGSGGGRGSDASLCSPHRTRRSSVFTMIR